MKLVIRFRDVALSPVLLDHVKQSIARALDDVDVPARPHPHPWVASMRVSLLGGKLAGEDWYRCRLEIGLRAGGVRVIEAGSNDVLLAVDVAADRLEEIPRRRALACAA